MTLAPPGALARALAADRARFNSKFAAARRYQPQLDQAAFAEHLRATVAPLVEAVDRVQPDRTAAVTEALYDLSLDLVSQDLLGPESRYPHVVAGWRELLPRLSRFVAEAPRDVCGAVTNALYNLSTTPGARPHAWAASMISLAEVCADTPTLLQAGQVAAWRAGMAHYRLTALAMCLSLQPDAARVALGLAADTRELNLGQIAERLRADPWLDPAAAATRRRKTEPELRIVARVGAFRGFGGLFLAPPAVTCAEGQFLVSDGQSQWLLFADRLGATFHRTEAKFMADKGKSPFGVEEAGRVKHGARAQSFPELETVNSWAANETTLAVTTTLSHAVYLVALT